MTSRIFILFGLLFAVFNAASSADGIMKIDETQGSHVTQPLPNEFCCAFGPADCMAWCSIRGAHVTQPLPNEFCCAFGPADCMAWCSIRGDGGVLYNALVKKDGYFLNGRKIGFGGLKKLVTNN